ncbi:hypothetical protein LINPERPRIM_LOCUS37260 [Linum perenne]
MTANHTSQPSSETHVRRHPFLPLRRINWRRDTLIRSTAPVPIFPPSSASFSDFTNRRRDQAEVADPGDLDLRSEVPPDAGDRPLGRRAEELGKAGG